MKILIVHGPNLNLLGTREPEIYGTLTLDDINTQIRSHARERAATVSIHQSNDEGMIIDTIQEAGMRGSPEACDAIVINPGAYTHYSVAIRDAIQSVAIPAVEVHLSNVYAREEFRRHSVTAPVCRGRIVGLGYQGYLLAIDALVSAETGD